MQLQGPEFRASDISLLFFFSAGSGRVFPSRSYEAFWGLGVFEPESRSFPPLFQSLGFRVWGVEGST